MLITTSLKIVFNLQLKVGAKPYYHAHPRWFKMEIHLRQERPAVTDELAAVIDHAKVRQQVRELLSLPLRPFVTLEAAALAAAHYCVLNFGAVREAEVTIFKQEPSNLHRLSDRWYEVAITQRVTRDPGGENG